MKKILKDIDFIKSGKHIYSNSYSSALEEDVIKGINDEISKYTIRSFFYGFWSIMFLIPVFDVGSIGFLILAIIPILLTLTYILHIFILFRNEIQFKRYIKSGNYSPDKHIASPWIYKDLFF